MAENLYLLNTNMYLGLDQAQQTCLSVCLSVCLLDYEQSLFRLVVRFRAAIFFRGFLSNNAWLSKKNLKGYS